MRKILVGTAAVTSFLAAASAANAHYFVPVYPVCRYVWTGYGWMWTCF